MGKGKGLAIAGIALVAFIVVAYMIVPSVTMPNSINLQWSVYGLKDGQRVTPPLAFISQGVEVDSLGASAAWDAQGESVDWDTLAITGEWAIFLIAYRGEQTDITSSTLGRTWVDMGVSAKSGSNSFSISLETLLVGRPYTFSDDTGPFWEIRVQIHLKGYVEQSVGSDVIEDTLDDFVDYRIYWQDGTFGLTGGINP